MKATRARQQQDAQTPVAPTIAAKVKPCKRPAKSPPAPATADSSTDRAALSKRDRVLTLLSRPDGATVPEMMQATGWQQHSVRGFLAGIVKKKLGFKLTSSKATGQLRSYRIARKMGG